FLLTYARAPVVPTSGANGTPETAQQVNVPCEIASRIVRKRQRDYYNFTAKKGEVYIIEVLSQRLGAPTDMYFSLRNITTDKAQDIVQLDDNAETLHPFRFLTSNRDPGPYRFVVPADGKYQLMVASHLADALANPHHYYQLHVRPERPDFRLVVVAADDHRPDACTVWKGGNLNLTVFAQRFDGFKGEIALAVEGLPSGVVCKPQVIGNGMKQSHLVFSTTADTPDGVGEIKIKGTATHNGQPLVREARTASIVWAVPPQQNLPTWCRLDRNLVLAVRDKAPYNLTIATDQITVLHGDKLTIPLKLARLWPDLKAALQIQPLPGELPPGLN